MKKIVALSAVAAVALSLAACGKTAEGDNVATQNVGDAAVVEDNATDAAVVDNVAEESNVAVADETANTVEANNSHAN